MSYLRNTIVKQAQSWLGCKESNGTHKAIIDVYNAHTPLARGYKVKYTDAWCAAFVSAVAIKAGYTAIIPTECSCDKLISLFKTMGCWKEDDSYVPGPGDYIFYDWQDSGAGDNTGSSDHVGIVEKVSGTTITVIEGNYSDMVKRRTMTVNGRYIRGYGLPKYTDSGTSDSSSATSSASSGAPSYVVGKTYTLQVDRLNVRTGAGTSNPKVSYAKLTANAKANAYNSGQLKKGTRVTCKAIKTVGSDIWMQIPSGWIAAYYSKKAYVK